jgi:hypothetical protein
MLEPTSENGFALANKILFGFSLPADFTKKLQPQLTFIEIHSYSQLETLKLPVIKEEKNKLVSVITHLPKSLHLKKLCKRLSRVLSIALGRLHFKIYQQIYP